MKLSRVQVAPGSLLKCPHRLGVRTHDFQSCSRSSILLGGAPENTMFLHIEFVDLHSKNISLKNTKELVSFWKSVKKDLESRVSHFESIKKNASDEEIFAELSFCIFTPQSKALSCWQAVKSLDQKNLLLKADALKLAKNITGVRFHNNKAKYLVEARNLFTEKGKIKIKDKILSFENDFELRKWLVANIKGFGYKEAAHFLRNIGMGQNLAILDRHILKNLCLFKAIDEVPETLTVKKYLEIEEKMNIFCKKVKIPMTHMDLLLWCMQTGGIFK